MPACHAHGSVRRSVAGVGLAAGFAFTAAVPAGAAPSTAAASPADAQVVCHLADHRIDEASGIGVGVRSPGMLYVQNDSGDSSRFFALNARTCATAAVVTVPHARNDDWEDLAVGPDPAGRPCVWLADIGDNQADRSEVQVYRVPEPAIDPSWRDRKVRANSPDVWRLHYPGGAVNAESFAVDPSGTGYVVTKDVFGRSTVYRLPPQPDRQRVQQLHPIGRIAFAQLPGAVGAGPFGPVGGLTATGAAISPNGQVLVVRTYHAAYVWQIPAARVAAALRAAPVPVALPEQPQGEGVTFDGGALLVDSEGRRSAIYRVPLPAALRPAAGPPPSAPPPSAPPSTSTDTSTPPAAAPSSAAPDRRSGRAVAVSAAVAAVVLGGAGLFASRRLRRRSRRDRAGTVASRGRRNP